MPAPMRACNMRTMNSKMPMVTAQDQLDLGDLLKVMLGLRFDEIAQDIFETKSGVASKALKIVLPALWGGLRR